jgi:hypothetical protein
MFILIYLPSWSYFYLLIGVLFHMFKNLLLSTGLCAFTVFSPCFASDSGAASEEDTSAHRTYQTPTKAEELYNILHNDISKWSNTYPVLDDLWAWAHNILIEDESGTPRQIIKAVINHFMDTPHIDETECPSILILKTLLEYTILGSVNKNYLNQINVETKCKNDKKT